MQIKDLITLLQAYNGDREIVFETKDGDEITDMVLGDGFNGEVVISEF